MIACKRTVWAFLGPFLRLPVLPHPTIGSDDRRFPFHCAWGPLWVLQFPSLSSDLFVHCWRELKNGAK